MITIRLQVTELMFDLRNKSHEEVKSIADVETRYRTEAGTEKTEEVRRCLTEAISRLNHIVYRWTVKAYATTDRYDDADIPSVSNEQTYVYSLDYTQRQGEGKDKTLADLMHELVVEIALARFYSAVSAGDLSNKYSLRAIESENLLTEELSRKSVPTSSYDTSTL